MSGSPSALTALLGANSAAWETQILRAYQTWAIQTNVNVAVVPDGGQPLGTAGLPQGDARFGDIRVAARPLGNGSLANTVGFDPGGGTWSGDLLLNSQYQFGVGDPTAQYDLYSVALHEAGHSFGIADYPTVPTSVMYPGYSGMTQLTPDAISAVQALYGVRTADVFEGLLGNGTQATAFNLTQNGNLTAISADITTVGDVDVYKFTTPNASGITGLTVNLQAAGVSLLTARVTILDGNGNPVASAVTTDPLNNNLSVTLPNYHPGTAYYIKVQGAGTDVFSAGAYNLRLNYSPISYGNSFLTRGSFVNQEWWLPNDSESAAQPLGFSSLMRTTAFTAQGSLSSPTDVDWYQVTPISVTSFTGTLTVGVLPVDANNVRATVSVFDGQGNQLPGVVVANENGAFTIQVPNQSPWTTYYIRIAAANPPGPVAVGGYALTANLTAGGVTTFDQLAANTMTAAATTTYSTMTVAEGKLTQFSLSAAAATGSAAAAVRMTVFNAAGQTVISLVAQAGKPLVTGTVWLAPDTYTIVYNAGTQDGSALPALTFNLSARVRTDPIDPYPADPTQPPPPPPPPDPIVIVVSPPVIQPPTSPTTLTVLAPFAGL